MNNYSLYDMLGLIKLGVWQGGEVETLGYVGRAVSCDSGVSENGLLGLYYLSYDVVILQNEYSEDGGIDLILGLYLPYKRGFSKYKLRVNAVSQQELTNRLIKLIEGEPKRLVWSHNIYKKNPFRHQPKHSANYSSLRSGPIGTTRRNR